MAIKIKGELKWLYRAVDKDGDTIDFLLSARRDEKAALRFLKKAIVQLPLSSFTPSQDNCVWGLITSKNEQRL